MPSLPQATTLSPRALIDRVRRDVERKALRARNGIRLATDLYRPALAEDFLRDVRYGIRLLRRRGRGTTSAPPPAPRGGRGLRRA